ncbi:MAG: hypothetical protein GY765_20205, partial [bacterium]|nr:hypothetical protein [bacterium]
RPGDTLFLTFVLQDSQKILPPDHPVLMELYNPKGQLVRSLSPTRSLNEFYHFSIPTEDAAITGRWKARVIVGGLHFERPVRIETVVPNRLKVLLDFGKEVLSVSDMPMKASIIGKWLHGADASNLKYDSKVTFSPRPTAFTRYGDFVFDDPTRKFEGGEQTVIEGTLDAKGEASFDINLEVEKNSPGMLNASFSSRVFEEGGGFSIDRISVPFHPYKAYVGLKTPKGDEARGMLLTDIDHVVNIASVDSEGKPVSREKLKVYLYKIRWKWWWDKSGESLAQYTAASGAKCLLSGTVATKNGMGQWKFKIKYPQWGRYLVRVHDPESGHSSGKIIYVDWPGWAGRAKSEKGVGATRLDVTADKTKYVVGEKAVVFLPETIQGRALVSLETGSEILDYKWVETEKGKNKFEIPLTENMSPNVYVHVTLLQPHAGKKNDNPIRLYGAIPLMVENPGTRLHPKLETADEFKPQERIQVKVSEQKGKAMTYTIAVVDEGLLGLTRFRTPDLRGVFYKREALGVKTWDMFDFVVGAYGAELERLLALGGDGEADDEGRKKKKRFPPVVVFKGPFYLEAGNTGVHDIQLPQYIGAVRVMVVAGHNGAYGADDKSVPVKKDLMMLSALPRIARPDEIIQVPVSVFVMNPSLKEVRVSIQADDIFEVVDGNERTVQFNGPGDQLAFFKLKARSRTGQGTIKLSAKGGAFTAQETIHLTVESSNPRTLRMLKSEMAPAAEWLQEIKPFGVENTNEITLEVSNVPPLNLEKRLGYLIRYPHGCLEQTVSAIFPQLYLEGLVKLNDKQKKKIEKHVGAALQKLSNFQVSSGGFSYWPGNGNADDWASAYAGHFLLEAEKFGYHVPTGMKDKWVEFQSNKANSWTAGSDRSMLAQAFRLYTLALARQPDLGAMNRLRESGNLKSSAALQLAAAFQYVGRRDAADDLIKKCDLTVAEYREHSGTYGSAFRDKALMVSTLTAVGKRKRAEPLLAEIVSVMGSAKWLSTQETAYALMAVSAYYGNEPKKDKFVFSMVVGDGKPVPYTSDALVFKKVLEKFPAGGSKVRVVNTGDAKLYAVLYSRGVPPAGEEKASANQLSIIVDYYDTANKFTSVDSVRQGKDIIAEIKISNPTDRAYENVVLTHMFPSGWQVHNPRFDSGEFYNTSADYQDIRDDRVNTYFSMAPKSRKVFRVLLNASFGGKYYLPAVTVEAMYDASIHARLKGKWIEVKK